MKTLITTFIAGIFSYSLSAQCNFVPSVTASGPTTFCVGDSVKLTASAGNSYLWNTMATTQSINVKTPGNYSVEVTIDGCGVASDTIYISHSPYWANVSCGSTHAAAIKSDGTLWTWGNNQNGQLGTGTTVSQSSPVQVGSDNDWVSVSCGDLHTLAIKTNGTLWAWGNNYFGQLGDGTGIDSYSPVQVGSDNDWVSVQCGSLHNLALKSDKTIWAWGNNDFGQLGEGTYSQRNSPVKVGNDNDWTSIACGYYHTLALKSNGTLWNWGSNGYGQLGDGTITNKNQPEQMGSGNSWIKASCGKNFTIAMNSSGHLWGWGENTNGQLGNSFHYSILSPVMVGNMNDWADFACGSDHTVAVKKDKTLWAWGYNEYGQLGEGTYNIINDTIRQIQGQTKVRIAKAGGYFSAIIKDDRNQICLTGENIFGELGDGTTNGRNTYGCNVNTNPVITTDNVSPLFYCNVSTINVPFTTSSDFTAGNIFTAQLSDANGSFTNPVEIGTLAATSSGTITGTIPAGIFAGTGYRVRVVVSCYGVYGSDNGSNITINPSFSVTLTATPTTICSGTSSFLTALGAANYFWSDGLGSGNSKTVSPLTTKSYAVTGTDNYGCSSTAAIAVTVNPSVVAFADQTTICNGHSSTLTATGSTGTYIWNHGLGTGPVKTVTPYGTTTYSVTGTTANGCPNTAAVTIMVNAVPNTTAKATPDRICQGSSTALTCTGATTYVWSNNLGTGTHVIDYPSVTTTYTVTGTNIFGCSKTATVNVNVMPLPNVIVTANPTVICGGQSSTLNASGAFMYKWSNGLGYGSSKTITPASTTTYIVTGTGFNSCTNTASGTINVNPKPNVTIIANPSSILAGQTTTLTAGGASAYAWSNGLGAGNPKTVAPVVTTTYNVTGTSTSGCTNTAKIKITIASKDLAQDDISSTEEPEKVKGTAIACYPNPFKEKTTVNISVPEKEQVRVDAYDLSGNLVKTLYDGNMNSNYTVEFDGNSLPQGMYICKVTTDKEVISQKMVLTKEQ